MAYVSTKVAADFLGLAPASLANWRSMRRADAPPYHKFGGRVVYDLGELRAWADAHRGGPETAPPGKTRRIAA